jgi:hypothetical protein
MRTRRLAARLTTAAALALLPAAAVPDPASGAPAGTKVNRALEIHFLIKAPEKM